MTVPLLLGAIIATVALTRAPSSAPLRGSLFEEYESSARERMISRDEEDGRPFAATTLVLKNPVWTKDRDFFGSGVSIWTRETIELYLRDP
jgi:hypothetical protein